MNYSQILAIIKQKIGLMILVGLLLAAVAFWGVMIFSPRYQSNFDVLVIQNSDEFVDSYTLAKSTEYVSKLLSESVYTETFFNKVIESNPDMAKTLPLDREDRMKAWGKTVRTSLNVELGMAHFKVLSGNREQAEKISKSIAGVLASNNNLFVGSNQKIEVRMLNTPIVKDNPGMGMLALLVLASFFVGAFLVFVFGFYGSMLGQKNSHNEILTKDGIWNSKVARDNKGNVIDAETGEVVAYGRK